jgi:thiol-disulfide isomerase/thioredoxin
MWLDWAGIAKAGVYSRAIDPRRYRRWRPRMNTKLAGVILVILGSMVLYHVAHPSTTYAADGLDPAWDAAVNGRDTTKPTVLFFTATWCPYCQELWGDVLCKPEVMAYLDHHYNFRVVELTTPAGAERANKFGVNRFPTLIRHDIAGHETGRINNSSQETLVAWLKAGE